MSGRNAARGRTRDVRHCDGATQVRWPPAGPAPLVDEGLADQLLGKAQAEGVELLGPDGLLSQVTKVVLERALAEEMTGHLGYAKHDPAGRGSGNSRNGPICLICAVAGLPELDLSAAQIGGSARGTRSGCRTRSVNS